MAKSNNKIFIISIMRIFNFKAILLKSDLLYLLTCGVDVFTFLQEFIILNLSYKEIFNMQNDR